MSEDSSRVVKEPTVLTAVVPLVVLILLIFGSLLIFGLDALDGPIQVALLLSCLCAELVALWLGYRWAEIEEVGRVAMGTITSAIFILLAVGALIGTWNLSGTIPTLVFYGIQALSPSWYYLASALICGVIAMSIGSPRPISTAVNPDPGSALATATTLTRNPAVASPTSVALFPNMNFLTLVMVREDTAHNQTTSPNVTARSRCPEFLTW